MTRTLSSPLIYGNYVDVAHKRTNPRLDFRTEEKREDIVAFLFFIGTLSIFSLLAIL